MKTISLLTITQAQIFCRPCWRMALTFYGLKLFMHRIQFTLFFLSPFLHLNGQNPMEIDSLPEFADSIVISKPNIHFKKVVRVYSDTVFVESYRQESSTGKSIPFLFYSLPLANIRSLSIDSSNSEKVLLEFKSVSRRFEFETQIPIENRSFDIPVIYLDSDLPEEIEFYKKIAERITPYIKDYKPDCSYTFNHYYGFNSEFFEGMLDENLVEKCSINSSIAKDSILTQLLKDNLTDLASKPRLKYLYLSIRINRNDEASEIYIGNHLEYENELSRYPETIIDESKNSHDHGGYLSKAENTAIVNLIRAQKWQTGKCDNRKVDTICLLNLVLN